MADSQHSHRMLYMIIAGLTLWGCLLALGAALFGVDAATGAVTWSVRPLRGAVVLGCFGSFLIFWLWVLRRRGSAR